MTTRVETPDRAAGSSWPQVSVRDGGAWRGRSGGLGSLWVGLGLLTVLMAFMAVAWAGGVFAFVPSDDLADGRALSVVAALIAMGAPSPMLARLHTLRAVGVGRRLPAAATRHGVDDAVRSAGCLVLATAGLAAIGGGIAHSGSGAVDATTVAAGAAVAATWPAAAFGVAAVREAWRRRLAATAARVAAAVAVALVAVVPTGLLAVGADVAALVAAAVGCLGLAACWRGPVRRTLSEWLQHRGGPAAPPRPTAIGAWWADWRARCRAALRPLPGHDAAAGVMGGIAGAQGMPILSGNAVALLQPLGSTVTAGHAVRLLLLTVVMCALLRSGDVTSWRWQLAPGGRRRLFGRHVVWRTWVLAMLFTLVMWAVLGAFAVLFELKDASGQVHAPWPLAERLAALLAVAWVDLWLAVALAACLRAVVPSMLAGVGVLAVTMVLTLAAGFIAHLLLGRALLESLGTRGATYLVIHALAAAALTVWADRLWRRVVYVDALQPPASTPPWRRRPARATTPDRSQTA